MIHRPLSITLVGASLVSLGILSVWGLLSHSGELLTLLVITTAIELIAGINILRGKNWARTLWTYWYILDLGLKISLEIHTPLLNQVIQLIFIYLLFRPEADAFFETD